MQSENMKGKFYAVKKEDVQSFQAVLDCKLNVSDIIPDRVLSSRVSAEIEATEILSGDMAYQGTVTIDAVVISQGNEVISFSSSFPFSGKVENSAFDPNQKVLLSPEIVDVSVEEISPDSIRFIVVVETKVETITNSSVDYFEDEDNDYIVKETTAQTTILKNQVKKDFNLEGEVGLVDKIGKVISVDADIIVKSVTTGNDYISIAGDADVTFVLVSDDEQKNLSTNKLTIPFKEEIEVEGSYKDAQIIDEIYVKKNQITTTLDKSDNGTKIRISFPVNAEFTVFENQEIQTVEDLYSLKNQTFVTTGSYSQLKILPPVFFESKIDGTMTLDENAMRIDKILAVTSSYANVTNSYYDKGQIIVSGLAKSTIIYFNEETNTINSMLIEIPFEVFDSVNVDCDDVMVKAKAMLTDVDVSVKRGREIFFDAKLKVRARLCAELQSAIISSVEVGDDLPEKAHAIEIYFASSGQTPWDIAKDMAEDVAVLYQYNEDLKEVMEGNEKIVVYHQKKINFD